MSSGMPAPSPVNSVPSAPLPGSNTVCGCHRSVFVLRNLSRSTGTSAPRLARVVTCRFRVTDRVRVFPLPTRFRVEGVTPISALGGRFQGLGAAAQLVVQVPPSSVPAEPVRDAVHLGSGGREGVGARLLDHRSHLSRSAIASAPWYCQCDKRCRCHGRGAPRQRRTRRCRRSIARSLIPPQPVSHRIGPLVLPMRQKVPVPRARGTDRESTRLNSSHIPL